MKQFQINHFYFFILERYAIQKFNTTTVKRWRLQHLAIDTFEDFEKWAINNALWI